jgi:hypothetical protein
MIVTTDSSVNISNTMFTGNITQVLDATSTCATGELEK